MYPFKDYRNKKVLAKYLNEKYGIPMDIAVKSARQAITEPEPRYMRMIRRIGYWFMFRYQRFVECFH